MLSSSLMDGASREEKVRKRLPGNQYRWFYAYCSLWRFIKLRFYVFVYAILTSNNRALCGLITWPFVFPEDAQLSTTPNLGISGLRASLKWFHCLHLKHISLFDQIFIFPWRTKKQKVKQKVASND